jgi:O-antigen ligase
LVALILLLFSLIPPIVDKHTLYENRGEIWRTALYAGYEHPVLGWGFGNTEVAFKDYNLKLYNNLRGYYVDSSHNFVLDWWVQGGVVGLTLLSLLLLDAFKGYMYAKNRQYLVLLLGVITVMSFNPVSVVTLVQFWWLISSGQSNR